MKNHYFFCFGFPCISLRIVCCRHALFAVRIHGQRQSITRFAFSWFLLHHGLKRTVKLVLFPVADHSFLLFLKCRFVLHVAVRLAHRPRIVVISNALECKSAKIVFSSAKKRLIRLDPKYIKGFIVGLTIVFKVTRHAVLLRRHRGKFQLVPVRRKTILFSCEKTIKINWHD